jgi:hypothetical protein
MAWTLGSVSKANDCVSKRGRAGRNDAEKKVLCHSLVVALLWAKRGLHRSRQVQLCVRIRCGVPIA